MLGKRHGGKDFCWSLALLVLGALLDVFSWYPRAVIIFLILVLVRTRTVFLAAVE